MKNETKISRRKFFKFTGYLLTIPLAVLWFDLTNQEILTGLKKTKIVLPKNLNDGVTFLGKIIVNKKGDNIKIFSSLCTHLGCRINNEIDDKLVCPCHGSEFSLNGKVLRGPAAKPLKKLKYVINKKTGQIVVYV